MRTNSFNICPTCIHKETCILTDQKDMVWSCSEFDEEKLEIRKGKRYKIREFSVSQ